jgi:hypothetical protein
MVVIFYYIFQTLKKWELSWLLLLHEILNFKKKIKVRKIYANNNNNNKLMMVKYVHILKIDNNRVGKKEFPHLIPPKQYLV